MCWGEWWFESGRARTSEGETTPKTKDNEVVVFMEYFMAGLWFPLAPFVFEVLRRFRLQFHHLNPNGFTKLAIFMYACRSHGIAPDIEGFLQMHRVHGQPRTVGYADGKPVRTQYGACG